MKQIKEGKMVGYKLSKNDLVAPFFVIFRSVREKLLVTVFFDHPVSCLVLHVSWGSVAVITFLMAMTIAMATALCTNVLCAMFCVSVRRE